MVNDGGISVIGTRVSETLFSIFPCGPCRSNVDSEEFSQEFWTGSPNQWGCCWSFLVFLLDCQFSHQSLLSSLLFSHQSSLRDRVWPPIEWEEAVWLHLIKILNNRQPKSQGEYGCREFCMESGWASGLVCKSVGQGDIHESTDSHEPAYGEFSIPDTQHPETLKIQANKFQASSVTLQSLCRLIVVTVGYNYRGRIDSPCSEGEGSFKAGSMPGLYFLGPHWGDSAPASPSKG